MLEHCRVCFACTGWTACARQKLGTLAPCVSIASLPASNQSRCTWPQTMTVLLALRCGAGCEPPEVAKGCLQDGGYEPLPSSDVYAFGLLLLATIGGQQPEQQVELQRSTAYLAELQDGFWVDSTQLEGQRKHLEWLRDLLVDPTKPDYADLVSHPAKVLLTFILGREQSSNQFI
jgi:hypothetical protein